MSGDMTVSGGGLEEAPSHRWVDKAESGEMAVSGAIYGEQADSKSHFQAVCDDEVVVDGEISQWPMMMR